MKTVNIKGKEYIEVNERLKYFRKNYTRYSLESEVIELKDGVITIKAIIKDENQRVIATGLAQEKESSSFINKTSFVENCETSAWGRALGNLGIGIDTSVASAEEVQNAINNQSDNCIDEDYDIISQIPDKNTIALLQNYYNEQKGNVKDLKRFNAEINKQKKKLEAK